MATGSSRIGLENNPFRREHLGDMNEDENLVACAERLGDTLMQSTVRVGEA
jgi:hypothetical protein